MMVTFAQVAFVPPLRVQSSVVTGLASAPGAKWSASKTCWSAAAAVDAEADAEVELETFVDVDVPQAASSTATPALATISGRRLTVGSLPEGNGWQVPT